MIIIGHLFPYYNHVCTNHLSPKEELYYELIENTFENTCVSDLIIEGKSVKVSETKCLECNNKYYIIEGIDIYCVMDEDNTIIRGYIDREL